MTTTRPNPVEILADKLNAYGARVYMETATPGTRTTGPTYLLAWFEGFRPLYCQFDRHGWSLSTKHKPNSLCGTGYQLEKEDIDCRVAVWMDPEELDELSRIVKPYWAAAADNPQRWADYREWENSGNASVYQLYAPAQEPTEPAAVQYRYH